jgi:hypothetical protein
MLPYTHSEWVNANRPAEGFYKQVVSLHQVCRWPSLRQLQDIFPFEVEIDLNKGQAATIIYAPAADFTITITGANHIFFVRMEVK